MNHPPCQSREEALADFFTRLAPCYEGQTRWLTWASDQRWRRFLAACLRLSGPARVLDLATGTGQMAIMIASHPARPFTVGLDCNRSMLERARKQGLAYPNLQFIEGDVRCLPFSAGSFDAISMSFGLRLLWAQGAALPECLEQCRRALKRQGRIYFLETSHLEGWKQSLLGLARPLLPGILARLNPELAAYHYLLDSMLDFPPTRIIHQLLIRAGFAAPRSYRLAPGWAEAHIAEKR
jgi:demethylmenaquinone methyltransferase/2-methoxy-6-polyprenyl-1,4-benzoquinol methylase